MTKAGIVTVAGAPNAGKSTLLNRIIGQKLAITSQKPQSTRDRVVGIETSDDTQMIIFDTPGLLEPKYALQEAMRATALRAIEDADVIVYLADASNGTPPALHEAARIAGPPRAPVIEALNKSDLLNPTARRELEQARPDAVFISARTGEGIHELTARIKLALPESPFLYPDEDVSTQSVRSSWQRWSARRCSNSCTTSCLTASPSESRSSAKVAHRCTFEPSSTWNGTARSALSWLQRRPNPRGRAGREKKDRRLRRRKRIPRSLGKGASELAAQLFSCRTIGYNLGKGSQS